MRQEAGTVTSAPSHFSEIAFSVPFSLSLVIAASTLSRSARPASSLRNGSAFSISREGRAGELRAAAATWR